MDHPDQIDVKDKDREPHLCSLLTSVLWRLAHCKSTPGGPPAILSYGLRHTEHTLHALADTIHAFQLHGDNDCVSILSIVCISARCSLASSGGWLTASPRWAGLLPSCPTASGIRSTRYTR
ncbi:E3 ubiquitin-protein ligase UBR4 [Operophtera brumata]|uniref:E3 ubiquitin-protein ligase UBR4 n=1 Tax=Operophtera brumata TaxID=104452 RepID=A0A0L7LCP9_OPEBR|nr:E3 ubiquitin-protein ligase UBR4 [Operophtera brumata]